MKKTLFGYLLFIVFLCFGLCLTSTYVYSATQSNKADKLTLSHKQYVLKKGQKVKLKAILSSSKKKQLKIKWLTSNKKIASVNKKGVVTAKAKKGTAIITAKAGAKKAKCKITIGKAVKKIYSSNLTLYVDDKTTIQTRIAPTKATIKKLYYLIQDSSIATVSQSGTVTAKKAGSTRLTIYATDCMKVSKQVTLLVKDKELDTNVTTPTTATIPVPSDAPSTTPSDTPTTAPSEPSASTPSDLPSDAPTTVPTVTPKGALSGTIYGKQNASLATPISEAAIHVYNKDKLIAQTSTLADGSFQIHDLDCNASYTVTIQKQGFQIRQLEEIILQENTTTSITKGDILTLLSSSVIIQTTDTTKAVVAEDVIMYPQELSFDNILTVITNPEGGVITTLDDTHIQVTAEDNTTQKIYTLQPVQRAAALLENTDYTIDYHSETIQFTESVDSDIEYRYGDSLAWTKLIKQQETGAFEAISLKSALNTGSSISVRKVQTEDMLFAPTETTLNIKRPVLASAKYYKINSLAGLRYGVEAGIKNQSYDILLSQRSVTDFSAITDKDIIQVTYTGKDSAGTYYECGTNYSHVYIRLASSDSSFASPWVEATYQSRDNEFDADDIP